MDGVMIAVGAHRPLPASHVVPPTQNTAPVLEFRCLYTSDLRRKQKRWQDGRIKYHTFNKRVMVYDERSNFVGDTYWREDYHFEEGEEVELERNGILVQASECIGRREQDLSELLDKRLQQREGRSSARKANISPQRAKLGPQSETEPSYLQQQSSGSRFPKKVMAAHPKAAVSPIQFAGSSNPPSAKRRRLNDSPPSKGGYAQNLTGATLSLSLPPITSAPRGLDPLRAQTFKYHQQVQRIDLVGDDRPQNEALAMTTRKVSKPEKSNLERSAYARNITGAVLTLSAQSPCPYLNGPKQRAECTLIQGTSTPRPKNDTVNERSKVIRTVGGDEGNDSISIEFFDASASHRARTASHRIHVAGETSQEPLVKSQRVTIPEAIASQQTPVESSASFMEEEHPPKGYRDQPSNPLRLKSRPKRKLLYMSDRQRWSASTMDGSTKSQSPIIDVPRIQKPPQDQAVSQEINHFNICPRNHENEMDQSDSEFSFIENSNDNATRVIDITSNSVSKDNAPIDGTANEELGWPKMASAAQALQRKQATRINSKLDEDKTRMMEHEIRLVSVQNGTISKGRKIFTTTEQCAQSEAILAQQSMDDSEPSSAVDHGIGHVMINALSSRHDVEKPIRPARPATRRFDQQELPTGKKGLPMPPRQQSFNTVAFQNSFLIRAHTTSEGMMQLEKLSESSKTDSPPQHEPLLANNQTAGEYFEKNARGLTQPLQTKSVEISAPMKSQLQVIKTSNAKARSKTVLGFVPSVEHHLGDPSSFGRTISKSAVRDAHTLLQLPAELANPATHSKIAALKAKTAATMESRFESMPLPQRPTIEKKTSPQQNDARLISYPVDLKREGDKGPWSREALDLFDWRPPVGR